MSVKEIRDQLIEKLGYSTEDASKIKKKDGLKLLNNTQNIEEILETAVETPKNNDKNTEIPERTSAEWTDYVLSLFKESELENKNPKTDALRRVAETLYDRFNIRTKVIDSPRNDNAYRASVLVSLEFQGGWVIDGCADVYSGNTDSTYAVHALATAETRAEGRALRKALLLTKVLAAEETYNAPTDEATGDNGRITQSMLTPLYIMCQRVGIDFDKLLKQQKIDVNDHKELTLEKGRELANLINQFQRKPETCPPEIKL